MRPLDSWLRFLCNQLFTIGCLLLALRYQLAASSARAYTNHATSPCPTDLRQVAHRRREWVVAWYWTLLRQARTAHDRARIKVPSVVRLGNP
jgi:hypothetical protein